MAEESLAVMDLVQIHGREAEEATRFDVQARSVLAAELGAARLSATFPLIVDVMELLGILAVMAGGSPTAPMAWSSVFESSAARRLPFLAAISSSDGTSAQYSPSESQRRCPSFSNCCACLGADPPAPVSNNWPPLSSGTIESMRALVPNSRIGNRSVR